MAKRRPAGQWRARLRTRPDPVPGQRAARTSTIRVSPRRKPVIPMSAHSSCGRGCRWSCGWAEGPISPTSASTAPSVRRPFRRGFARRCRAALSSSRSTRLPAGNNSRTMATRGQHLVHGDRGFATGGGLVARLLAPAFAAVLDHIDRRLAVGGIETTLPDGSERRIGFRAAGPSAVVHLASWMALLRLATSGSVGWYKAWALGEWSSPDPVANLRAVLGQRASSSAKSAAPRARSAGSTRSPTASATTRPPRPAPTSPPTTTSATTSTPPGSMQR